MPKAINDPTYVGSKPYINYAKLLKKKHNNIFRKIENNQIQDTLEGIYKIAHDHLEASVDDRRELEDKKEDAEPEDIINTLESIIDYLEGGFRQILNTLKD